MPFRRCLASIVIVVLSAPAWGQEEFVVVTGSRIRSYTDVPAVVVRKRADFLVQLVDLTNDTRAAESRREEIYQTIRDLLADASKRPGIALGYGNEFLVPITPADYRVPLDTEAKRADTSTAELYVKMALGPQDDVGKAIEAIGAFIRKARVAGRTEIEPQGDIGLSIVDPERYRYEIIAKIAEDAKRLRGAVGEQCTIQIGGLSGRVTWQRSDISELTLFIPYDVLLTGCR